MWTNENRARYDRSKLRYPERSDRRGTVNGLMYILSTGCQWAALPPRRTVNDYSASGTMTARWTASIMRFMSNAANLPGARPAQRGKRGLCIDPPGYDAGKKIKGKKRHFLVDTQGLLLHAIVHAADIQDRDGGVLLMSALFGPFPFLLKLYADSGYQGEKFKKGLKRVCGRINVEIVKRSDAGRFVVLPKRWIVERTIGCG